MQEEKKNTHADFSERTIEAKPGQNGFSNFLNTYDGFSEDVLRRAFSEEKRTETNRHGQTFKTYLERVGGSKSEAMACEANKANQKRKRDKEKHCGRAARTHAPPRPHPLTLSKRNSLHPLHSGKGVQKRKRKDIKKSKAEGCEAGRRASAAQDVRHEPVKS